MDLNITFGNIPVSIYPQTTASILGISLEAAANTPMPEIFASDCSCESKSAALDIANYKICTPCDNTCAICRAKLSDKCIECDGIDSERICQVIESYSCSHMYHFHCISTWLFKGFDVCPICASNWILGVPQTVSMTIKFGAQNKIFGLDTKPDTILELFNLDKSKYVLVRNKKPIETDHKFIAGNYSICTIDSHSGTNCIEVNISNMIQSTTTKTIVKYSTKLGQLKKDIASTLNIMTDRIILDFKGKLLTDDISELNVFNIGVTNGSTIFVRPNNTFSYEIGNKGPFIVAYIKSSIITDSDNIIRNICVGRMSWLPLAYVKTITDADLAVMLSALYVLIKKVDKSSDKIDRISSRLNKYIRLYIEPESYATSLSNALCASLYAALSTVNFVDLDRTILTMGFYELITAMKSKSASVKAPKALSESNVLFNLLLDDSTAPQLINWDFAKKKTADMKIFNIYSPAMITNLVCPVLTYDDNLQVAVFIERGKAVTNSVSLFQPINDTDHLIDPAALGKKVAETIEIADDNFYDEAVMICIDISNSMQASSDFKEDIKIRDQNKTKALEDHGAIWHDAIVTNKRIIETDIADLRKAIIWFITNPSILDWKKHGPLDQIVCFEQYDCLKIAQMISKYRSLFYDLRSDKTVCVGKINYSTKRTIPQLIFPDPPNEYICPITSQIMEAPVLLDDGYTYERESIITWLKKVKKSPMTNLEVDGHIVHNRNLKSLIDEWKKANPPVSDIGNKPTIKLGRETNDLEFGYDPTDTIYDLMLWLYNVHNMNRSEYKITRSGYTISPDTLLSDVKGKLSLQEHKKCDTFTVTVVNGLDKEKNQSKKFLLNRYTTVKEIIYKTDFYPFDRVDPNINARPAGDNYYNADSVEPGLLIKSDTVLYFLEKIPQNKSKRCNTPMTRLDVVKRLFDAYIDRSIAYSFKTSVGLMSFGTEAKLVCHITPFYECFREKMDLLNCDGETALYDCVYDAATHLAEWKKAKPAYRSKAKLRIICLTDGCESGVSKKTCSDINKILAKTNATLDCIAIGNNSVDWDFKSTINGYKFNPKSIEVATDMVELETMISSIHRDKYISFYFNEETNPPIVKPAGLKSKALIPDKVPCLSNPTNRIKRIMAELSAITANPHPDIDIYVNEFDIAFWKIIFAGPDGTPYASGTFMAYLSFPIDYPEVPPEMRFVTPIKHCNINSYGRVCHSIFDRNYLLTTSIQTVLNCVYGLLLNPDVSDPLDSNLALLYYKADGQYEANIIEHIKFNANKSRKQWLTELTGKINLD